jgi:hypothetical protein
MENKNVFRKSMGQFVLACVGYTAAVAIFAAFQGKIDNPGGRVVLGLLPVFPTGIGLYYYLRALRATDELQQRIFNESLVISALLVGALSFAYAFLELAGFPRLSTFLYFPLMIVVWGFFNMVLSRRYQ